jgi:dTDP-4-dehydrorhamnose 3,5-epimerase
MKTHATCLPGVVLVELQPFADERGSFMETWQAERYRAAGIPHAFVQSNHARSHRGVLRGLHYQLGRPQAKLVWVPRGEVFDVAVDVRRGSPTFGRWYGTVLSETNNRQLFVPEGFAHGYFVMSEVADFIYSCSDYWAPAEERGLRWDDPAVGISWPAGDRIVSAKDQALPFLAHADLPELRP